MKRTNYCGDVTAALLGTKQTLCGWVNSYRNHGGVLFIDVRDRSGICQVVVEPSRPFFAAASAVRNEYVVEVTGTVQRRIEGAVNKNMKTGEIEVVAEEFKVLNTSIPLPFDVNDSRAVAEEIRMKYRYLDLRNPKMFANLLLRHRIAQAARRYLDANGFLEVETPILTRSTPEGARDYLVPSRVHHGEFYALPQSPQMFKQTLMASGIDRYFQLARCFRDEDLRADRQPEHTQIDMEMSFVTIDDIHHIVEGLMKEIFKTAGKELQIPFAKLSYHDAMEKYGSDKPDLRYTLQMQNANDVFKNTGFKVFKDILAAGGAIRALRGEKGAAYSRGHLDKLTELVKKNGAKGLVWIKVKDGKFEGPSVKFFTEEELKNLQALVLAQDGDIIFVGSDANLHTCQTFMGALRKELVKELPQLCDWAFVWITNFPLLEYIPEEDRWDAAHNPFTAPVEEDLPNLEKDPGSVRSYQFDLVLNGNELASGSVRNCRREVQERILALMKHSKEEAARRFGMLLNALEAGAPPHGGIGLGLDRITALLAGEESIREVIAFPKTAQAVCPLTDSPNVVDDIQLKELGIALVKE
ncbi:MAG: aspartate--tRNA ligase [Elusimicrobia bacterium]|nr:aspartate--tRNA ligase [Elusimicrobiota bacterium]MDY5729005.1 aspartate--tRNA ligase [Elusimicrobiaceae bacterium]